jgi:hypothetical protein
MADPNDDEAGELPESLPIPPGALEGMTREERIDEFIRQLAAGHEINTAAHNVGLHRATVWRWRKHDAEFDRRVREAMAVTIPQLEAVAFRVAMRGNVKMLAFLLERRAPERYGRMERLELTNPDGSLAPSPEDRASRVEALLAMARARKAAKAVDDLL